LLTALGAVRLRDTIDPTRSLGPGDRATKAIAFIDRCGFTAYGGDADVPAGSRAASP
jgi:hypothetical protein